MFDCHFSFCSLVSIKVQRFFDTLYISVSRLLAIHLVKSSLLSAPNKLRSAPAQLSCRCVTWCPCLACSIPPPLLHINSSVACDISFKIIFDSSIEKIVVLRVVLVVSIPGRSNENYIHSSHIYIGVHIQCTYVCF